MTYGQNDSVLNVSLKEAQEFAVKNSPVMKSAQLDIESARKKVWETTAIGLPQVSGKVSYSYMITVPPTLEMFNSFSGLGGNFGTIYGMIGQLAAQQGNLTVLQQLDSLSNASSGEAEEAATVDDMRWGLTADLTVSQLVFSGAYLVGLQTTKVFKSLTELALTRSEKDLRQNVASGYYLVLMVEENARVLDSTLNATEKLYDEMKKIFQAGLMDETDVDQLNITVRNIRNAKNALDRQRDVAYNLLKYQMGYDLKARLILTETLNSFISDAEIARLVLEPFSVENTAEYQLLETQVRLNEMNVKLNKVAFLPDVVAFYQHQENFNDKSFSFTPPDLFGLSMSIPIFSSGSKLAKLSQAKIDLQKTRYSHEQATQGMQLDFESSKNALMNAYDKYITNRDNMTLAEKIHNRTLTKFREGLSSSMELTQAQSQYLTAQSNFYNAMYELLTAKAKIEKMLNKE
jgi:outer membrane protein TolC